MPNSYLKSLHTETGKSMETLEKAWKRAKKKAKEEGEGKNYAYITAIFKKMIHENVNENNTFHTIRFFLSE